ncbi:MAG TPA: hypothetical protein VHL34_11890 [Rhizomicrobium sp.]|jgi:TPR repeat protein|nr:hypothetical protein [Rhizomicrobium sp.]
MRIAAFMLGSVLLTGPALAQITGGPGGGYPGDVTGQNSSVAGGATGPMPSVHSPREKVLVNPADDAQTTAEQLLKQGQCDRAVVSLRRYANAVGGEISQYTLGLCLFELAKSAPTPEAADAKRKEGAVWLLRSANAGYAKAQAQAVALYMDGMGVEKDPVEAEKWALLYGNNVMRRMLRMPDLAPDLQSRVEASLSPAQSATAQSRANAWGQTYWPPQSYSQ